MMVDLTNIDSQINELERPCRIVTETPKGRRSRYIYEPALEAIKLSGLLPAGVSFRLDFGFASWTLAEDGDKLGILLVGGLMPSIPVGFALPILFGLVAPGART
jgi:inorganic pyrophosphatase